MVSPELLSELVDELTDRRAENACWPWRGPMLRGRPYFKHTSVLKFVYEREYGTLPPGMQVGRADCAPECPRDCIHSTCVNPRHLTIEKLGGRPMRTACPKGHDLTIPENVYEAAGRRWCKQCKRENRAEWSRQNPRYQENWRKRRK